MTNNIGKSDGLESILDGMELESIWRLARDCKNPQVQQEAKKRVVRQLVTEINEKEFIEKLALDLDEDEKAVLPEGRGAYRLDRPKN